MSRSIDTLRVSWLRGSDITLRSLIVGRPTSLMHMPVCRGLSLNIRFMVLRRREGRFDSTVVDYLQQHHEVDYIEEDLPMFTCEITTQYVYPWTCFVSSLISSVRSDAPWHLQRINRDARLYEPDRGPDYLKWQYSYDSSAGAGVDIYVLGEGFFDRLPQLLPSVHTHARYGRVRFRLPTRITNHYCIGIHIEHVSK